MANPDMPNGFRPYNDPYSGGGQPQVTEHDVLATNAAIGIGSPVAVVAGGVDHATAGAGNALLGIAAEAIAANEGGKIKVWSDPQQLFVAQTDNGTGTATALAAVGLNIDFIGTGVAASGLSTAELDESSAAVTANCQFKIMRLADEINGKDVNAFGEFNRFVVKINNHQKSAGTGTAGV